ncbi:unnamed protein product [Periconia digitata]|uniref:Siderophore iron transporter mirB n=1 Tax=Periconia digitata TaxID=1303443 RepID=A0A9W4UNB1_9PLEO|nr:unnamed protein product [Periconia digitata]
MSQIFIAFAGGACVITEQIAVMAATEHQYIAVVLALEGMASSIGGGIGSTMASVIWTDVFPKRVAAYLPEEAQGSAGMIYGSLTTQLSYPKGTPTRVAIEKSYGDAQEVMCIASTAVLAVGLAAVMMWRDIRVRDSQQK